MFQPTFSRISYLAYRFRQFRRYHCRHCHFCGAFCIFCKIGFVLPRGWGEGDMQPRNVPVCHRCYHHK